MEIDNTNILPVTWNYHVYEGKLPSENIRNFLNLLSLKKNIEFFTPTPFEISNLQEGIHKSYEIIAVSVIGEVNFLKSVVKESFNDIKVYLETYVKSLEAIDEKMYELSKIKFDLQEFIFMNNINDPILLDLDPCVVIHSTTGIKKMEVQWDQCDLSDNAKNQIQNHIYIRYFFVDHLYKLISLHLDKLILNEGQKKSFSNASDSIKEMQLLEVWIALSEMGFCNHLNDKLENTKCRKEFFRIFGMDDKSFNTRNNSIKSRKTPKALFLNALSEKIESYQ